MEKYRNNGKTYDVEEAKLAGAIINVNGTSITDYKGKIISVIERRKYDIPTYGPVTWTRPGYEWGEGYELVCLVEENK